MQCDLKIKNLLFDDGTTETCQYIRSEEPNSLPPQTTCTVVLLSTIPESHASPKLSIDSPAKMRYAA